MTEAYILMKATPGCEREICNKLKKINEVKEINELYGEWDIIIKAEIDKLEELDSLLSEKIRMIEGITLTSTMIVAKYKH